MVIEEIEVEKRYGYVRVRSQSQGENLSIPFQIKELKEKEGILEKNIFIEK